MRVARWPSRRRVFGTNIFDHPFGSDVEDPGDGLDDEDAQLEAHAGYVRVLEAEVAAYADAPGDDADLLAFLGERRMNLTPWNAGASGRRKKTAARRRG